MATNKARKFLEKLRKKKTMDNKDQDVRLDLDTPATAEEIEAQKALDALDGNPDAVEEVVDEHLAMQEGSTDVSTEPTEEKKTEDVPAEVAAPVVQPENTAEGFNCAPCKGSGLIQNDIFPNGKICEACNGTGRVN